MDSAAARGICRREGVGKVKSLEVRTLWLQQVVKAKTLTLKTVKSQDNRADLGTETVAAGTESTQKFEWIGGQERHEQRSLRSASGSEQQRWRYWNER